MKRTAKGNALATFGNALRNYLGLEPLYQVGRDGERPARPSEAERFDIQPFTYPQASNRKRFYHDYPDHAQGR